MTTRKRIQELEQQIAAHSQAERERIEKENQHKNALAELEQLKAQAEVDAAKNKLAELKRDSEPLLNLLTERCNAMRAAIDAHDLPRALESYRLAVRAFETLCNHNWQSQNAAQVLAAHETENAGVDTGYRSQKAVAFAAQYKRFLRELEWGFHPNFIVIDAIRQAIGNEDEYRIRRGMAMSIIGENYVPQQDYDWQKANEQHLQHMLRGV